MQNKKLILFGIVFLLFIGLVSAVEITDAHGETLDGNGAYSLMLGVNISVDFGDKLTGTLISVGIHPSCTGNEVVLIVDSGDGTPAVQLAQTTNKTGSDYFFDTPYPITNGTGYVILHGKGTSSYTRQYANPPSFPYNTAPNVNFIDAFLNNTGTLTVSATLACITNITTEATPSPPASNTLNLSTTQPLNLSSFNSVDVINFNLTANATYDFNCSFYLNDTFNQSIDNFSSGENIAVDFNSSFITDGEYNFTIGCYDGFNDINTSTNIFYMDFVNPSITTDFVNNSVYYLNNLTGQFNFSDNIYLYSFNLSVDDKLINQTTGIGSTTYTYDLSYYVSNLTSGRHNLTVTVADGHTSEELKSDYDWSNGLFNDYMKYEFYEGGYIKTELKDSSFFDSWTTTRLKDRYTQTFVPNTPTDTYTFVEESDQPIYIINKPGHYNDHWIIIGTHWKDYVVKNEPESKVSIKRITANKVEVTVSGIKNNPGRLEFESIGDLNIVEQQYNFYVANATVTYSSPLLELTSQTMYLRFNKTSDINTNAVLYYNGSLFSTTKTSTSVLDTYYKTFVTPEISTAQENITFYWEYNLYAEGTNETGNLTFNQTVNNILFDNCTTYTVKLINFTVKNESSGVAIIDNSTFIDGNFEVWTTSGENLTEFNISWGNNESGVYGLCAETAPINYTFNAQMQYGATGFSNKLYYFNNYLVDNNTDEIGLFLTDSTTQVTLTVKDFDDSVVTGASIKVLSYDIGTDSFSTTEIVETDTNGEATVQLVLYTEWYAFIVEVDGEVKLQTLPTKISSTTKTLRIDLSDIKYFDRYDVTRGIIHSLTWTNSSNTFTFTWSDPSGDVVDACLKVTRDSVGSSAILSDTCTTSTAGTKLYTITDNITDQTYTAVSYVKFSDTEIYILDTLTQSFEQTFKKFGLTGIFVSFLLVLTLVGVGIWSPVIATLFAIFGLIIVSILGIFSVGWGALMGLIIMGGIIIYKLTKN